MAKKATTHTHTRKNTHHMKNKKNKRNLKRSFRFKKICSGFVYCIYEYVFEKLVDIEIYLISIFFFVYFTQM